ncbi:MAG: hypothetical protein J0M18_12510, partial [Ignavibacteria bacterium]|nr:hypothetical protein [Ignavibacteria bacterium]
MQKLHFLVFVLLFLPVSSYCENIPLFTKVQPTQFDNLNAKYLKEVSTPQFLSVNKESVKQILNSDYKNLEISIPLEGSVNANLKL